MTRLGNHFHGKAPLPALLASDIYTATPKESLGKASLPYSPAKLPTVMDTESVWTHEQQATAWHQPCEVIHPMGDSPTKEEVDA